VDIKAEITQITQEKLTTTENFLVEVKVSPSKIAVIIDHPKGVKIDDCVLISRFLHEKLDSKGIFDTHELEVGSPGMEEPLKIFPQYKKRIGQQVSVLTFDGVKRTGKLLKVDEQGIELNEERFVDPKKKKEVSYHINNIPFTSIKETKVIFSFDKNNSYK
jgi:ribosome maturation factor RimP